MAWSRFSTKAKVLTLDRFAEIYGLNPVAFNQATFEPVCHYGCMTGCNEFWYQGPHQIGASHVTRDDLAQLIVQAERDLANFLGFPICPEEKCITMPYNGGCGPAMNYAANQYYGWLPGGSTRALAQSGRRDGLYVISDSPVLAWGRQTLLELATVPTEIYDRNGDLYTTKNMVDCPSRVHLEVEVDSCVSACELEVYHVSNVGDNAYRLHNPRIQIVDGIAQIDIEPWLAVRPELWEEPAECGICLYPGVETSPILDLLLPAAYPAEFVVTRRYFDRTIAAAQFGWHGTLGCSCGVCDICRLTYCPGCVVSGISPVPGVVKAMRGSWNATEEAWCASSTCTACARDPDFVKIYYWHGYSADNGCAVGPCFDCSEIEDIVAMMVAARLPRKVCQCTCNITTDRFESLQETMNFSSRDSGTYFLSLDLANNPFGTRRGEVDAFRRAAQLRHRVTGGMVTTGAY